MTEIVQPKVPRRRRRKGGSDYPFQDVDLTTIWGRLDLTGTQLSRLTGVSRRQVEWWRRRGYLSPSPEAPDRFNGDAVTLALLMKQALDNGIPLARAYDQARRYLAHKMSQGVANATAPSEGPDRAALLDLEQKLLATHNTIGLVLEAVAPLAKRVEQDLKVAAAEPV